MPGSPLRTGRERTATGIGLALAWHGAGFTGSGEVTLASVVSLELTADGRIRVLTASTEMGQGTKTIFPQLVAEALGVPDRGGRARPAGHRLRARLGPDRRVADGDGRRAASLIKAARRLRAGGRGDDRRHVRRDLPRPYARANGAAPGRPALRAVSGRCGFDDATYRGDAYPAFGWAACVARSTSTSTRARSHVRDVVAADDVGRVIHPVLAEGQVEGGTLQAVGYATIEEIKLRDGRYLNDRLATYIIPTALDAPRITTILVEAPFAGAPHGAKGVGELPMDVGAPAVVAAIEDATGAWIARAAGQPGADPGRARGGAGRRAAAARRVRAGDRRRRPMSTYAFTVNGAPVELDVPGMRRLLDVLREDLALTGTKEGCGEGECGACTVLLDGAAGRLVPRADLPGGRGRAWPTVEGLAPGRRQARSAPDRVPRDAAARSAGSARPGC